MAKKNISVYLSFLLRHRPETIHLSMDKHGWVLVEDLIEGVNKGGRVATIAPAALSEAGTFASAASGGRSEQKGVAAVKIL